jgi:branched-chain amino acid transport system ATP-binding protein
MVQMIQEPQAAGVSLLLSEQNMHFAALVADRAYVLEQGEVRFSGTMEELRNDADGRRDYLGG